MIEIRALGLDRNENEEGVGIYVEDLEGNL